MIKLEIPGKPIAKKRPRFARIGKFVRAYSDQETEESRFLFHVYKQIGKKHKLIEGPVVLILSFYMPIPKSTSKKKKALMLENDLMHTKKPDLDNLIKFVKDCCNNLVWKDDSQVVHIWADKRYSEKPRTTMRIYDLNERN